MTPNSHSCNEINYAVNVNKEDCANNQIIKQYGIPTSFFVKLGWSLLLIRRNCCKCWVVLIKAHMCGKLVICKIHYQVCNMLYRFFLLQQHLTLLETEPAFSFLIQPSNPFIYRLKYIKVSFSNSSFGLGLRS